MMDCTDPVINGKGRSALNTGRGLIHINKGFPVTACTLDQLISHGSKNGLPFGNDFSVCGVFQQILTKNFGKCISEL
jgi:hypothetical protein